MCNKVDFFTAAAELLKILKIWDGNCEVVLLKCLNLVRTLRLEHVVLSRQTDLSVNVRMCVQCFSYIIQIYYHSPTQPSSLSHQCLRFSSIEIVFLSTLLTVCTTPCYAAVQ